MKFLEILIPIIVIIVCCRLIDLIFENSYRWCKKKNSGKPCGCWNCKNAETCHKFIDCAHGLRVLGSSRFYVLDNEMRLPVPDYITEDSFPITFTNGKVDFTFQNLDDMAEWALTVYDELYRKPDLSKKKRRLRG